MFKMLKIEFELLSNVQIFRQQFHNVIILKQITMQVLMQCQIFNIL